MKALNFIILLWIIFTFLKMSNVKVKLFSTNKKNIHVKYENSGTHYLKSY